MRLKRLAAAAIASAIVWAGPGFAQMPNVNGWNLFGNSAILLKAAGPPDAKGDTMANIVASVTCGQGKVYFRTREFQPNPAAPTMTVAFSTLSQTAVPTASSAKGVPQLALEWPMGKDILDAVGHGGEIRVTYDGKSATYPELPAETRTGLLKSCQGPRSYGPQPRPPGDAGAGG